MILARALHAQRIHQVSLSLVEHPTMVKRHAQFSQYSRPINKISSRSLDIILPPRWGWYFSELGICLLVCSRCILISMQPSVAITRYLLCQRWQWRNVIIMKRTLEDLTRQFHQFLSGIYGITVRIGTQIKTCQVVVHVSCIGMKVAIQQCCGLLCYISGVETRRSVCLQCTMTGIDGRRVPISSFDIQLGNLVKCIADIRLNLCRQLITVVDFVTIIIVSLIITIVLELQRPKCISIILQRLCDHRFAFGC